MEGIVSAPRIARVAHRHRCFNYWQAPTRQELTLALSATPSMLARATSACVASRACSNWSINKAARLPTKPVRRHRSCASRSIASYAAICGAVHRLGSLCWPSRSTHRRTQPVSRSDPVTHPLRGAPGMNLIELNGSLVPLRLSGGGRRNGHSPSPSAAGEYGAHRPGLYAGL